MERHGADPALRAGPDGNVKSLLPGPCQLSLPTTTSGDGHDLRIARAGLVHRLDFAASDGSHPVHDALLSVVLWQATPPAA